MQNIALLYLCFFFFFLNHYYGLLRFISPKLHSPYMKHLNILQDFSFQIQFLSHLIQLFTNHVTRFRSLTQYRLPEFLCFAFSLNKEKSVGLSRRFQE